MIFDLTNDQYAQIYGDTYTEKIEYLARVITQYETERECFNVLNFETGFGKSRYADLTIREYLLQWGSKRNFLIVKRFNSEIEHSVNNIKDIEKQLKSPKIAFGKKKENEEDDIPIVLGITAENWKEEWRNRLEDLKKIKVIYISHQRYIRLCENEDFRNAFKANRHTLIIDEKINFPIYTYNDKLYSEIRGILPHSLRLEYDKVCKKLNDILAEQEAERNLNQCIRVQAKIHPATLENFKEKIENIWDNLKSDEKKKRVKYFMKGLELWYSMKSIYNGGNISTYNPEHRYWGLKNNIILDASAGIDLYKFNKEKFKIIHQSRIVDHSKCKFIFVDYNSSKANIKNDGKYYFNEIAKKIIEHKRENDRTLIVCHKENSETIMKHLIKLHPINDIWLDKKDKELDLDYNGQSVAISWLGNLIGKNTFSDFTQVWIVGTPNIPYEQYLVAYMQYKGEDLGKKSLKIVKGKFENKEFRQVQIGIRAAEIYQSIKRIQRNAVPEGEFFIVNNDEEIKSAILSQIRGVNQVEVMELNIEKDEEKQDKKLDQVEQFIEYIMQQPKGTYQKKDISEQLKITKLNRVLSDIRVQELIDMGKIRKHTRYIQKL